MSQKQSPRGVCKKVVFESTCASVSFLIKLQGNTCNFMKKETLALVFPSEFCEISKNTFSDRTPPVAASVLLKTLSWK